MKTALKLLFSGIFLWMIVLTIRTSLAVSLWSARDSFAANPWAVATLYDAYFGFITFWIWVAYKENTLWSRLLWLVLILGLGNIAMSLYVLIQLFRLKPDQSLDALFQRDALLSRNPSGKSMPAGEPVAAGPPRVFGLEEGRSSPVPLQREGRR